MCVCVHMDGAIVVRQFLHRAVIFLTDVWPKMPVAFVPDYLFKDVYIANSLAKECHPKWQRLCLFVSSLLVRDQGMWSSVSLSWPTTHCVCRHHTAPVCCTVATMAQETSTKGDILADISVSDKLTFVSDQGVLCLLPVSVKELQPNMLYLRPFIALDMCEWQLFTFEFTSSSSSNDSA